MGAFLLLSLVMTPAASPAIDSLLHSSPPPATSIQHIVILQQENHSFDNYFGAFPGLAPGYNLSLSTCEPKQIGNPLAGCVRPFNADNTQIGLFDLNHNWTISHLACDSSGGSGCQMDGFVSAQIAAEHTNYASSMAYYTGATIPNYWDLASYYSLDANFFSSELAMTYPNRLYTVAAQAGGIIGAPPIFTLNFPTIVNELTAAHVTWKYYMGGWDMSTRCHVFNMNVAKTVEPRQWRFFWSVLPDFPAVQQSAATCKNLVNSQAILRDISEGTLPQVSWVIPPEYDGEHPGPTTKYGPNTIAYGQEFTTSIIDAIESNPSLWSTTAIFLTYDEFGGYYDGVAPTQLDGYGYGFRLPLIAISPYSLQGVFYGPTPGVQQDLTALLATIESNWHLAPLTSRDATVRPLWYMFNFTQSPRPPLILPTTQLAVYPLSSCYRAGLCNLGTASPTKPNLGVFESGLPWGLSGPDNSTGYGDAENED